MAPERPQAYARRMAGKRFLGALLMAVGGMIALLCGLCSIALSVSMVASALQMKNGSSLWFLIVPTLLGGLPAAGGIAVFIVGLNMFREGLQRRGDQVTVFD